MVMTGACHGNGADHCCYWPDAPEGPGPDGTTVPGVCPFLRQDAKAGRRWSCGLMDELGDWNLVHSDPRYLATLQPLWRGAGPLWEQLWAAGIRCGTWPQGIPALKENAVKSKPELRALRDSLKGIIEQATAEAKYVSQAACCWGGQPPEA